MIVIAAHDNISTLETLLNQLHKIDIGSHDVLVVDTNSTDKLFLSEIEKIKLKFPDVKFDRINEDCGDSGAYIHAYKTYHRSTYIFLQDSLEITNPQLILHGDKLLSQYDVVPVFEFNYSYDTDNQRGGVTSDIPNYSKSIDPEFGIFGPIFGVNRNVMDRLNPIGLTKIPNKKGQGCGMERRGSLMFKLVGATKFYLDEIKSNNIHLVNSKHDGIKKIFFRRE